MGTADAVKEPHSMRHRLKDTNFDVVFARMREAKRTAKALSSLLKVFVVIHQRDAADIRKSSSSISLDEPESHTLNEFVGQLLVLLGKQARLSMMVSKMLNEEVVESLNQLRLELKSHAQTAFESYNRSVKALDASELATQKCRDRIRKFEKHLSNANASSNPILAALAAANTENAAQSLPSARSELEQAIAVRDANRTSLEMTKAEILTNWETMESYRMQLIVKKLERAVALTGSLDRQNITFKWELECKLKNVSCHDDIGAWVDAYGTQPESSWINAVDPALEVEVTDAPDPVDVAMTTVFEWTAGARIPLLQPTASDAKLLALCTGYTLADAEQRSFSRRDLRVYLLIRESTMDSALMLFDKIERSANAGDVLNELSLSFDAVRLATLIIIGRTTMDLSDSVSDAIQNMLEAVKTAQSVDESIWSPLEDVFQQRSSVYPIGFASYLYRHLLSAIVDDPSIAYDDTDATLPSLKPVSDDWLMIIERLGAFRHACGISASVHAAAWIECILWDAIPALADMLVLTSTAKVDLTEATNAATTDALNAAADCFFDASNSAYTLASDADLLNAVRSNALQWLEAVLSDCFRLSFTTLVQMRQIYMAFSGNDARSFDRFPKKSAERFYDRLREENQHIRKTIITEELVNTLAEELTQIGRYQGGLEDHCESYRSTLVAALWIDIDAFVLNDPSKWLSLLGSLPQVLMDLELADRLASKQMTSWIDQLEVNILAQIDKMLMLDSWNAIDENSPYSSSVIDLFSAISALVDASQGFISGLRRLNLHRYEGHNFRIVNCAGLAIEYYARTLLSSSRPSTSSQQSKHELRTVQNDCNHLIRKALAKFNARSKLINITKSVKSKIIANRRVDGGAVTEIGTATPAVCLPTAASSLTVPELILRLNNCRECIGRIDDLRNRFTSIISAAEHDDPLVSAKDALLASTSEIAQLVADRLVFADLEAVIAETYFPSPSGETTLRAKVLQPLDQSMESLFAELHDAAFPAAQPMFPTVVLDVFSSMLSVLMWITGVGAGDRIFHDIDYTMLVDDLSSLLELFQSELPEDMQELMAPVELQLESMALSSNELVDDFTSGRASRLQVATVLHRRTDHLAINWLKGQQRM